MAKSKPVDARSLAMFGHVASTLRAFVQRKGWSPGQLNEALGYPPGHTGVYHWLRGRGAPGAENRARLAKLIGIPESELTARQPPGRPGKGGAAKPLQAGPQAGAMVVPVRGQTAPTERPGARAGHVLGFTVSGEGSARLTLDITLPLAAATPLLRMILDAGIVFSPAELGAD